MTKAVKQRVHAEATFSAKGPHETRATVPAEVRAKFGARSGDRLIWDEGCDAAVLRAALKGPYFVVRLERAPEQAVVSEPVAQGEHADTQPETLAESVQRRLTGATRRIADAAGRPRT